MPQSAACSPASQSFYFAPRDEAIRTAYLSVAQAQLTNTDVREITPALLLLLDGEIFSDAHRRIVSYLFITHKTRTDLRVVGAAYFSADPLSANSRPII